MPKYFFLKLLTDVYFVSTFYSQKVECTGSLTLNLHKFTINSISLIKPFALVSHSEAQFVSEMGRSIIVVCTQPLQLILSKLLVSELE